MTTTDTPTQRLHNFYRIAAISASASKDPHYLELMDDLHLSLKAVAGGDDPTQTMLDQANEWIVTAHQCASQPTAERFKAWAAMLKKEAE